MVVTDFNINFRVQPDSSPNDSAQLDVSDQTGQKITNEEVQKFKLEQHVVAQYLDGPYIPAYSRVLLLT